MAVVDVQQRLGVGGARSLPMDALEQLRRRAVAAVQSGMPRAHVARQLGVSRKAVGTWVRAYESGGELALRPRRRGRRAGERLALSPEQQAHILATLASAPPDDLDFPGLLWTRKTVGDLIHREYGLALAGATVDHYFFRWELLRRNGPFSRWVTCPPDALLVAWARPGTGAGAERAHALVAVSNRGLLHFLAAEHPFTESDLVGFRARLRVQHAREVRLLAREWPADHIGLLRCWTTRSEEPV